jgi:hypothetical protein
MGSSVPHTRAMGMTRKFASVMTVGLIDYRSDKERIAKYTRQTRNAARAQARQPAPQYYVQPQQQPVIPPGWYRDPAGAPMMRWWDGGQWTPGTQPLR